MTKKEELILAYERYPITDKNNQGIILFLQGIKGERELIANPEGLDKLEYIKQAYNDELELVNNPKIKIVGFQFFNNNNPVDINISLGRKMIEDGE